MQQPAEAVNALYKITLVELVQHHPGDRRFEADAESNLRAFALRLKEAMPELVTVHETRGFFSSAAKTTGVSVDLPRASATALNVERKPIAVSLNEQGQLFVMDEPIGDSDLVGRLQAASQSDVDQRIYLRASKVVPYGRVAEIMATVTSAGFKKVALVTEPINR